MNPGGNSRKPHFHNENGILKNVSGEIRRSIFSSCGDGVKRLILLILCGVAGIAAATLLSRSKIPSDNPVEVDPSSQLTQWTQFLNEQFAGDHSCRECHQKEFEAHQRSGHSHTATRMEQTELAQFLNGTQFKDPRRSLVYEFENRPEGFFVGVQGADSKPIFPVHWLLGSGLHAQTPISIDPVSGKGLEFRWTWFNQEEKLSVTPDHERFDDFHPRSTEVFGRPMDGKQALACLSCHATIVPPANLPPLREAVIANVSCERCHGPRKNHVELAKSGRAHEAPPLLTYRDPEQSIQQCAQCHRDESQIAPDTAPNVLVRFQPYGMKKSRCYLESGKTMTCMTCHDPHDQTSKDRTQYNTTCLQCHQGPQQTPCPQSPAGDCVSCHMPAVEWRSGIQFHDHWIRVLKDDEKPDGSSLSSPAASAQEQRP